MSCMTVVVGAPGQRGGREVESGGVVRDLDSVGGCDLERFILRLYILLYTRYMSILTIGI